jgi:hypothetical protein
MTSKFTELAIDCADPQRSRPVLVLGPGLRVCTTKTTG